LFVFINCLRLDVVCVLTLLNNHCVVIITAAEHVFLYIFAAGLKEINYLFGIIKSIILQLCVHTTFFTCNI